MIVREIQRIHIHHLRRKHYLAPLGPFLQLVAPRTFPHLQKQIPNKRFENNCLSSDIVFGARHLFWTQSFDCRRGCCCRHRGRMGERTGGRTDGRFPYNLIEYFMSCSSRRKQQHLNLPAKRELEVGTQGWNYVCVGWGQQVPGPRPSPTQWPETMLIQACKNEL